MMEYLWFSLVNEELHLYSKDRSLPPPPRNPPPHCGPWTITSCRHDPCLVIKMPTNARTNPSPGRKLLVFLWVCYCSLPMLVATTTTPTSATASAAKSNYKNVLLQVLQLSLVTSFELSIPPRHSHVLLENVSQKCKNIHAKTGQFWCLLDGVAAI